MDTFLNELNNEQRLAVEATEGPILILAGAGSGKTRTLTYKIAYLISKGIDPFNILALTFTNKAAKEMKERVELLLGSSEARNVWMGTFHSVFARILRMESEKLGYPRNFTIYDADDSKRLIRNIVKNFNLCDKTYKAASVLGRISSAKSNLISAKEYINNTELTENDKIMLRPEIGRIFDAYSEKCFRASAMDFDDLLLNMNNLLRDHPDVLSKYQKLFKYILVDEYQDTNYAQYLIVKKLAANNENVSVVGDDAQSIYAFRGANIENILNLKRDYPDLKTFKLEQNYRSTQTIVNAANSVIYKNKNQLFKKIWTDNDKGAPIKIIKAATDNKEAHIITSNIQKIHSSEHADYNHFAVLYRTNAQSRSLEEALRRNEIPYRIYGGISFYQRKEVKDLIAYFRLIINHNDDDALLRIINYPARGIGKTSMDKIVIEADKHKVPMWDIITNTDQFDIGLNSGAIRKVENFVSMIQSLSVFNNSKNAFEMAQMIAKKSGLLSDLYEDKTPEGVMRFENIEELLNGIKAFTENDDYYEEEGVRTLSDFVQSIALLTDADKEQKNTKVVSLMTIHAAKGLEFPYVFVSGVEENLFPSLMSLNSRSELEEERRLFYVAITRAMKKLFILYAESRFKWGNIHFCEPSRFIDEIAAEYLEYDDVSVSSFNTSKHDTFSNHFKKAPPNKTTQKKVSTFGESKPPAGFKKVAKKKHATSQNQFDEFSVGMNVEHNRFGKGKLIGLEGSSDNRKATVLFDNEGQKQLLLKYARLKII